ncbi:MAG TPA: hypothetical protein VHA13_01340 [Gammaproteobacteria bacterium]|nr:hypothetical protein [Gammaproteobacteria bacterium]
MQSRIEQEFNQLLTARKSYLDKFNASSLQVSQQNQQIAALLFSFTNSQSLLQNFNDYKTKFLAIVSEIKKLEVLDREFKDAATAYQISLNNNEPIQISWPKAEVMDKGIDNFKEQWKVLKSKLPRPDFSALKPQLDVWAQKLNSTQPISQDDGFLAFHNNEVHLLKHFEELLKDYINQHSVCGMQIKKLDAAKKENLEFGRNLHKRNNEICTKDAVIHKKNAEMHERNAEIHERNAEMLEKSSEAHKQKAALHRQNAERCEELLVDLIDNHVQILKQEEKAINQYNQIRDELIKDIRTEVATDLLQANSKGSTVSINASLKQAQQISPALHIASITQSVDYNAPTPPRRISPPSSNQSTPEKQKLSSPGYNLNPASLSSVQNLNNNNEHVAEQRAASSCCTIM